MIYRILNRIKKEWKKTPLGRTKKNDNPMRWGIIGLGYMAETFSCAIDGSKDDVVYAVASRNINKAKRFANNHGRCRAYGSYEDMVNDRSLDLDVIYIATPVKYHYVHIKMCLEAGRNVLCEKPITSTLEEFEELIDLSARQHCFLMEGMWMKCLPTFQKACQWINEGKIGDIELVRIDFYKREHIRDGHAIYNASEGGGILLDYGVYAIAFMEHFLGGYPDIIEAYKRKSAYVIDADWNIVTEKNNILAFINLSANFGSLSKAVIIGHKGYIEWDSQFNRSNRVVLYDVNGLMTDDFSVRYSYEGFEFEVKEVHRCIAEGMKESTIVTLDGTLNSLCIINKLLANEK